MRRNISITLICLVATALMAFPGIPTNGAQDNTPTPEIQSVTTPVVSLPFSDTFDFNNGWEAHGAWEYDIQTAYEGSGWFLNGAQREMISTLEYTAMIDMSGALSAQLIFRRKGFMPPSDLIAIDLSLNGGESWFMIDQEIGLDEPEWDAHAVDLTDYRGQVIRLRFRVNTGVPITEPGGTSEGYWIDNLSIQYVLFPTEMVVDPIFAGPRTLMGLHLVVGAQKEPVLDLARRLQKIGWPLGTLKGTTGTEDILNEVSAISPETVTVYRSLMTPGGMFDCPNTANDPVDEARVWLGGLQSYWSLVQADYYEIINECLPPIEWLLAFSIEAMRVAGERGQCLLLFSFGPGNPTIDQFSQLLPAYQYALEHPCQPGRHHGIALHAYGIDTRTLVSESGIYLGLRHRLYYAHILSQIPQAIQIPVLLTEAGAGDGSSPFACEDVTRDVIQYTRELEYDPYIRGFHLWTMGGPQGRWLDVTPCLPMIGDALVSYYSSR